MPQLLVVEMLLADASQKLNTKQVDLACHVISQAACILDKVALPAPQALESIPTFEMAPVVDELVIAAETQVPAVPVLEVAVGEAKEQRSRAMAAAA